jgi:hypothetical protein
MHHKIRRYWHKLIIRVFRVHFQDVLTNAIHPEFGWMWDEGQIGHQMITAAEERGLQRGLLQASRPVITRNPLSRTGWDHVG